MTDVIHAKYSRDQVSKRDGSHGSRVWIIIKDNIIDVTDHLDQHPGGREAILEYAGKDATKAFNNVGHSTEAQGYLKGSTVGDLIDEDKSANKTKKTKPAEIAEKPPTYRSFLSIITCGICS